MQASVLHLIVHTTASIPYHFYAWDMLGVFYLQAMIGVAFSVGFIVGPMIGAAFSIYGVSTLLSTQEYPFQLPALFAVFVAALDFFYLYSKFRETLPATNRVSISVYCSLKTRFLHPSIFVNTG